jgi:hypothetical protein
MTSSSMSRVAVTAVMTWAGFLTRGVLAAFKQFHVFGTPLAAHCCAQSRRGTVKVQQRVCWLRRANDFANQMKAEQVCQYLHSSNSCSARHVLYRMIAR